METFRRIVSNVYGLVALGLLVFLLGAWGLSALYSVQF